MYLSTITLKNFRKYAYDRVSKHGITVNFHKGLNALIGENDSGKSAIIDAIKLVLQTQSGEFTRVTDEDFYISATGEIATEFSIDCTFEGFEINELPACYRSCAPTKKQLLRPGEFKASSQHYLYMIAVRD